MTIYEYSAKYGGINLKEAQAPEIAKIRVQGFRHLFRTEKDELISEKRPFEASGTKEWREKNRRLTSHDVTNSAILESSAIINSSGLAFTQIGEDLKSWLDENKFEYIGTKIGFFQWLMECIYPLCLADPNSKVIILPLNNKDITLNPNDSDLTQKIKIDVRIIHSEHIIPTKEDAIFIYCAGEKKFTVNGQESKYKYYYIADEKDWYIYEPTGTNEKGIVYTETHWYNHALNRLPVVQMPGVLSQDEKGRKFQESFFKGAFPHLDEHTSLYSDMQIMDNRNSYPIFITPPIACSECGGEGMVKGDDGHLNKPCVACGSTGKQQTPGISQFIMLSDKDLDKSIDARKPSWLAPEVASLEYMEKKVWSLLDKACASIGINSLIGSTESGEAMKMRMQKFENLVNVIYDKLLNFAEDTLYIINKLISTEPSPTLKREVRVTVKTPEYLRLIYKDALPVEKAKIAMEILLARYGNDPIAVRIFNYVLDNHPSALLESSEIKDYVALGIYTIEEVREGQTIINKLDRLAKDFDLLKMTDEQIKLKLNGTGQV